MAVLDMKTLYDSIKADIKKEFSYKSIMQVPRITKIVISSGVGMLFKIERD